jgi:hypothetical protein
VILAQVLESQDCLDHLIRTQWAVSVQQRDRPP